MHATAADWIPAGASALVAMYHRMPESLLWLAVGASHGKILMVVLCREEAAIPTPPRLEPTVHCTSSQAVCGESGCTSLSKHPASQPPPYHHIMSSSAIRESAGERARKRTCFPPSIDDAPPKDLLPSLKRPGVWRGVVRDQTFCGTGSCGCSSSHIESEELPCRERVSGPESVFVQSATQILLLCSIHPSRFRHCFDGWAAQRFDSTGQGDDKPLTPRPSSICAKPTPKLPHPLLDPSVGARAHARNAAL